MLLHHSLIKVMGKAELKRIGNLNCHVCHRNKWVVDFHGYRIQEGLTKSIQSIHTCTTIDCKHMWIYKT